MTDADVVLGYIDPDNFLGGRMKLDQAKAVAAVKSVADKLGLSLTEAASGIAKIAEFKMADIIRKMTVEKGYDPRDFVLFAFGGAGPVHASVFGAELGVQKVIVPLREIASTWCAFGAAAADILHVYEQVDIQGSPFDPARVNAMLDELQARADAQMEKDGIASVAPQVQLLARHAPPRPDQRGRGACCRRGGSKATFAEQLRQRFYDALRAALRQGLVLPGRAARDRDAARARDRATPRPKLHEGAHAHGAIPHARQARHARRSTGPSRSARSRRRSSTARRSCPATASRGRASSRPAQTNVVVHAGTDAAGGRASATSRSCSSRSRRSHMPQARAR